MVFLPVITAPLQICQVLLKIHVIPAVAGFPVLFVKFQTAQPFQRAFINAAELKRPAVMFFDFLYQKRQVFIVAAKGLQVKGFAIQADLDQQKTEFFRPPGTVLVTPDVKIGKSTF